MSNHEESRPVDRETAERLLRGDLAIGAGNHRLDGLLAAAAAPAFSRELAGEEAAVAAFEAAQLASPQSPRRISMLKSTLAKLLTVKVAAACIAVGGAGGVALAASTGNLPGPLHKPAAHESADPSHSPAPHPSGSPSARPSFPAPPADLLKLCAKYEAHPGDKRKDDLEKPEFDKLVKGAGRKDRDRVDHFCGDLRRVKPSGTPPSGFPSGFPTDSPSGKPQEHQSGQPAGGASGKPGPRPGDLPSGQPVPTPSGR
jgi:hypothetical protein